MNPNETFKRLFAGLLLTILLTAYAGRTVHIHTEKLVHFAAFCGDRVPDNGASCGVSERCIVDDFGFYPCPDIARPVMSFRAEALVVLRPEATRCRASEPAEGYSLRAPPGVS